ncbi:Nn.00g003320.m01.CDS01 [Neocucurbitaria sp. VM-36]
MLPTSMVAPMTGIGGNDSDRKFSNTFYAELLDTGVFSDITFKYGKHHMFKLHSMVLMKKSTWFAQQIKDTTANSRNSFEMFHEGFQSSWLARFKHPYIKGCNDHEIGNPCLQERYLNDLFHFCYLDEYPPQKPGWQTTDSKGLCLSHIFMYMLGLQFGVNSLLVRCVDGFTSAITSLDGNEKPIAHFLNIIFDLPDLKADDLLLIAAKFQTKTLVNAELGTWHAQFTSQVLNHRFTKAMPKPVKDYLNVELDLEKLDLLEPDISQLGLTIDSKCARCANSFNKESTRDSKNPTISKRSDCRRDTSKYFKVRVLRLLATHALADRFELPKLVTQVENKFKEAFAWFCTNANDAHIDAALQLCFSPDLLEKRHIRGSTSELLRDTAYWMLQQQVEYYAEAGQGDKALKLMTLTMGMQKPFFLQAVRTEIRSRLSAT